MSADLQRYRSTKVPAAVTVRDPGNPRPRQNSMIDMAANCDNRDLAISLIMEKLCLFDGHLPRGLISDPVRWRRMPTSARLMEIGDWLRAECYEAMDLVRVPDISTIGD